MGSIDAAPAAAPDKRDGNPAVVPLGWRRALLFASGDFACNLYWQSVALYLLFYYTDIVQLAPEAAGLIYMAGSIWDGVAGLIVGVLADRARSRSLQAHVAVGAVPLALSFLLLYWVPPLTDGVLVAAALCAQLLFRTLYAAVNVPYAALSAQVARSSGDRARIAGLRMIFGAAAAAVVAAGTQAVSLEVSGRADAASGFFAAAALFAAVATVLLVWVGLSLGSGTGEAAPPPPRLGASLRSVVRNRPFLALNAAMFGAIVAITMVTKATLYYFKYRIGDEAAAGGALALMGLAGVAFVPLWMAVSARWGSRSQWFATTAIGAASLILFALLDLSTSLAMSVFLVAFQAAVTGFSFGFWAMLPDTIDHGAPAGEARVHVLLFGLAALLQKIALGLAAALVGLLLGLAGYVADAEQGANTLAGLKAAMTLVPLIALGCSAIAMAFNPLRHLDAAP